MKNIIIRRGIVGIVSLLTIGIMAFRWSQPPRPLACDNLLFSYGIIADCQYCNCSPSGNSYYGNSIPKLQEAVDTFNAQKISHALHLGDFIQKDWESYDDVEPVYSSLDSAHYYALGNHEFTIEDNEKPLILSRLGMPDYYYDFTKYNWRFIVLESTELAFYSEAVHPDKVAERDALWAQISNDINNKTYNGGISQEQLNWLDATLTDAKSKGQKAVVFAHHPVWPLTSASLWNYQDVIDVLEAHNNVVAYMNGHNHAGNYAIKNGIHYVTFQGMLLTADQNSFSVVEVFRDRLEVNGYGRQSDFTLPFAGTNQAPQDISLNNLTIDEFLPTGTLVGDLEVLDTDYMDYAELQFATGAGDTHNSNFHIQNNQLFTNTLLNADDSPLSILLQATDCGGAVFEKAFSIEITPNCITSNLYVFMEGAYNVSNGNMSVALNTVRHLLPGQTPFSALITPTPAGQPYAISPWNYTGNEGNDFDDTNYTTDVVDWVLVSLRTDLSADSEIVKVAGLLNKNGRIDLLDSCLRLQDGENYYIVIEHRSHLPVMSHIPVSVSNRSLDYDFRVQNSYRTMSSSGAKEVASGVWAMYGGNTLTKFTDFGYEVNGDDKSLWFIENGIFDKYTPSDMNLDGDINGADKSIWVENNGIFSSVPK